MTVKQSLFFVIILMIVSSCKSSDSEIKEQFLTREFNEPPVDVKLPIELWDLLEEKKVLKSDGKIVSNTNVDDGFAENVVVGMIVRLREKTPGILGGANIELKSSTVGLSIDLGSYLKMDKGTFNISFEPTSVVDSSAQVFFISNAIQRQEQDQKLGAGCNKIFDITKVYLSSFKGTGVDVNVTDGRHVSFLAGHFFIRVSRQNGVRAITHLSITDSRYSKLLCEAVTTTTEK